MRYDNCPRCNIPWKKLPAIDDFGLKDTQYCNCGLYVINNSSTIVLPLTANYPKDTGARLYWSRSSCRYTSDRKLHVAINLPKLPFTITPEEVAKYLVLT